MCGIAGFEIAGMDVAATSGTLVKALSPRGPDRNWSAVYGPVALVETRLSVIDLSDDVVYPMGNEDGQLHLVFNGEIYDHDILRRDLAARGYRFRTRCDAEVVIHGFEEWGVDLFPRLNGMFALAIVDDRHGEVVLARDRLGIKPLVRTTGSRFAFASDAIALVEAGLSNGKLDVPALQEFVAFHYVPPPGTGIADILQVAPGTLLRRRRDGSEVEIVWADTPFGTEPATERVTLAEAERALLDAVRRQLVADVDVGVFLSGGLDSGLVLSAAAKLGARPRAFTLAFAGHGDYDESTAAGRVAKRLGVPHEIVELHSSFSDAVTGVAGAYDVPFADSSAVATLELARFARRSVTVALSGTGGDDLFAGYYRHRAHQLRPLVQRVPTSLLRAVRKAAPAQGRARRTPARLARSYLARLAEAGAASDATQYLSLVANLTSRPALKTFRPEIEPSEVAARVARRFGLEEPLRPTTLRAIQRFELLTYVPGDLLCKEDRATMAVGLEGRVPLVDNALVDLAERAPQEQLMSLRRGKIILRKLAERFDVPLTSLKRGFAIPLGAYFAGPWRGEAREWFGGFDSELVDGDDALALLAEEEPRATDLWMLATLTAWEQRLREVRSAAAATSRASLARLGSQ